MIIPFPFKVFHLSQCWCPLPIAYMIAKIQGLPKHELDRWQSCNFLDQVCIEGISKDHTPLHTLKEKLQKIKICCLHLLKEGPALSQEIGSLHFNSDLRKPNFFSIIEENLPSFTVLEFFHFTYFFRLQLNLMKRILHMVPSPYIIFPSRFPPPGQLGNKGGGGDPRLNL